MSYDFDDYFLVCWEDEPNVDRDKVYDFLLKEGIKYVGKGWTCPWVFVEINNKIFRCGMPGVEFGRVIGKHAITFEEFKTIYNIYKKYKGLKVLKFKKE